MRTHIIMQSSASQTAAESLATHTEDNIRVGLNDKSKEEKGVIKNSSGNKKDEHDCKKEGDMNFKIEKDVAGDPLQTPQRISHDSHGEDIYCI